MTVTKEKPGTVIWHPRIEAAIQMLVRSGTAPNVAVRTVLDKELCRPRNEATPCPIRR